MRQGASREGRVMTLHLIKMAVGVADLAELRKLQKLRRQQRGKSVFFTRNMPKRVEELLDGGSIYWVVKRQIAVRQRLKSFAPIVGKDGEKRVAVEYAMQLVPVMSRPCRPFQGWRYLTSEDAPKDRPAGVDSGERLPPKLAKELRDLGLL